MHFPPSLPPSSPLSRSRWVFNVSSAVSILRREHCHLQRVGGRACGNAHELSSSLTARAEIKHPRLLLILLLVGQGVFS